MRELYIADLTRGDILHFLDLLPNRIWKEVLLLFMSEGVGYFEVRLSTLPVGVTPGSPLAPATLLEQGRTFE